MGIKTPHTFNYLLLLLTLAAGVIWWGLGEVFISTAKNSPAGSIIRNPLCNGFYFAFLPVFTILACLLSERICHSVVEKDFFEEVVLTPSLLKIIPAAFAVMAAAAGILEFAYEAERTPSAPAQTIKPSGSKTLKPGVRDIPVDYYFLLDNTTSLKENDPDFERIQLLEKTVDGFSEDRKIALISFADKAAIHIRPGFATTAVKNQFKDTIKNLVMINYTNLKAALESASSILSAASPDNDSRKEVVIFITDGEDNWNWNETSPDFNGIMAPFITRNVPVHTIFLDAHDNESNFLKAVSEATGGTYSTVKNPAALESYMARIIEKEEIHDIAPVVRTGGITVPEDPRDLLEARTRKTGNSPGYALLRIACITLIGLLSGYLLYIVFSSRRTFMPLLAGGGISGVLAGLILEFSLQKQVLPDYFARFAVCVVLSAVLWIKPRNSGNRPVFSDADEYHENSDNIIDTEKKSAVTAQELSGK